MRKIFAMLSGILLPLAGFAQGEAEVIYEEEMYALKISPNGQFVGNCASNAAIYVVATGEQYRYPETYLGLGNSIADTGMAVGSINDNPALLYQGNIIRPENYLQYWFGSFHGITRDGTKVVGFVNNTERGIMYLPFVADVDAAGNVSDPVMLPHPDKDLFNGTPQFVTAVWISDDGNVIIGQVLDSMGYYNYPIVFRMGTDGEWTYSLPTEDLFNPTGIKIPENPWENEPSFPEPENFMSGALKQAYQEAYEAYISGTSNINPVPEQYMTDEEYEAYAEAVETYNDWFYGEQNAMREYIDIYNEVLSTSPTFALNDFSLSPDGTQMAQLGGVVNESNRMEGKLYLFDNYAETLETMDVPSTNAAPKQILPDGTIIVATPVDEDPTSWLLLAGQIEFITVPAFLQNKYPELADYVAANFANGSGVLSSSYDMSILTGGLFVTCLTEYNEDINAPYYSTYIMKGLDFAGIESVIAEQPTDGIYRVYNLNGVKVMETKDAAVLNELAKGLYIINGKKIIK